MSIRCVCANGHVLKVSDKLAGGSGLCPVCRARVNVPQPAAPMSEDAIMDILGRDVPQTHGDTLSNLDAAVDTDMHEIPGVDTRHLRICNKCQREVPTPMHVCPFCHTYIATLRDF